MIFIGFVKNISRPTEPYGWNCYYGLNVSGKQEYEPVDQLDGFVVAKALQQDYGGDFYPYIAGIYGVFNTTNPRRARKAQRMLGRREAEKKQLLEELMSSFDLSGRILTTYDLWNDPEYWRIFSEIAPALACKAEGEYRAMPFREFPKELLGAFSEVSDNGFLDEWDTYNLYLPAEVAEAIYLRDKYAIDWKLGPLAEEMYDKYLRQYGLGIIQFRQPRVRKEDGTIVDACPYIGKESECGERIFIFDDENILSMKCSEDNPSYLDARVLSQMCGLLGLDIDIFNPVPSMAINTFNK